MIGDATVSEIGFGGMALSIENRPDEGQAIKTIHKALDSGINLIDTADAYCLNSETEHGHNERLISKALATWNGDASSILVATKGGKRKPQEGVWPINGRPEYIKESCELSLKALGVDCIGLYHLHAKDPNVPYVESLGAVSELISEGKVRQAGISNVDIDMLTEALGILPVASVQNELSALERVSLDVVEYCTMFGIAFLAYSPLGGASRAKEIGVKMPALQYIAGTHGVSAQQVALAWLLAQSPLIIPIPSSTKEETVQENVESSEIVLSNEDISMINDAINI